MKRKAYKRQLERTRAIFTPWIQMLGLSYQDIRVNYYDSQKEWRKGHKRDAALTVRCDWRYLHALIDVNAPLCAMLDDKQLEIKCVHELCHILVNEMRTGNRDHEERVVCALTNALIWTRNITRDASTHTHE